MKKKILKNALIMGTLWPLAIYLVCAFLDVAFQESKAALAVMAAEAVALFLLPIFMFRAEKKISDGKPPLWTAPVYLTAYALITVLLYFLLYMGDTSVFFSRDVYLGGIGFAFMLMILTAGFVWAVVFRLAAATVRALRGKKN